MKLLFGFIMGIIVGGYLATNMTEQQRSKVGDMANRAADTVSQSKVGSAVADNAAKVTNKVGDRVVDEVDSAGDKAAGAVDSDTAAAGSTTS